MKILPNDCGAFDVGVYVRLSREDLLKGENESLSIINQKDFLINYCRELELKLVDVYVDDGYTGTNFNRPGFKKMVGDIEKKIINTVVVKDLSRLGRDYIETGYYIEKYFPSRAVRFIAVNDGIDTLYETGGDMTPFKAVVNDMYAKDISRKVKTAFKTKMKNGYFLSAFAPYGYKIEPFNKGHFVIDEAAAKVVRRVFDLYLDGNTYVNIARILTEDGVETPSAYKERTTNLRVPHGGSNKWHPVTIKRMLTNKAYTGCVVQNKVNKISYKIDKYKAVPPCEWIVVPNMHDPIISGSDFDMVQRMLGKNNVKVAKNSYQHLLSGLVVCGDCGSGLSFSRSRGNFFTVCRSYKNYSADCTPHMINEQALEQCVLDALRGKIVMYVDKDRLLRVVEKNSAEIYRQKISDEQKILEKKLKQIKNDISVIYEDRLNNMVDEDIFREMMTSKGNEQKKLCKRLEDIVGCKSYIQNCGLGSSISDAADKFLALDEPCKVMINSLINKIIVFEDKSIEIEYNFNICDF